MQTYSHPLDSITIPASLMRGDRLYIHICGNESVYIRDDMCTDKWVYDVFWISGAVPRASNAMWFSNHCSHIPKSHPDRTFTFPECMWKLIREIWISCLIPIYLATWLPTCTRAAKRALQTLLAAPKVAMPPGEVDGGPRHGETSALDHQSTPYHCMLCDYITS